MNSYVHKSAKECLRAHRGGLTDWDGWVQGTERFVSGSHEFSREVRTSDEVSSRIAGSSRIREYSSYITPSKLRSPKKRNFPVIRSSPNQSGAGEVQSWGSFALNRNPKT